MKRGSESSRRTAVACQCENRHDTLCFSFKPERLSLPSTLPPLACLSFSKSLTLRTLASALASLACLSVYTCTGIYASTPNAKG